MSCMLRTDWLFRQGKSQVKKNKAKRTLSCEPLEDRRVLATMVGTEVDLRTALANGDACVEVTSNITLIGGELAVTQAVEIDGGNFTIDGNGGGRVFNIDDGDGQIDTFVVTISDVTITGGAVVEGIGGGLVTVEETTMNNVTVTGNSVTTPGGNTFTNWGLTAASGGGISTAGTTIINDSLISGNTSSASGSVYYDDGAGTTRNYLDASGGGISAVGGGSLTINNTTVSGNTATSTDGAGLLAVGGGIRSNAGGGLTIADSYIDGNLASYAGGGLSLAGEAPTVISGTNISNNVAGIGEEGVSPSGGGIDVREAASVDITLADSTVSSNTVIAIQAEGNNFPYGGGVTLYQVSGSFTLTNSDVTDNLIDGTGVAGGAAVSRGGGVFLRGDTRGVSPLGELEFTITGGELSGNLALDNTPTNNGASFGGNLQASGGTNININGTTISGGQAAVGGGFGTLHFGGLNSINIANATVTGNIADIGGGVATWRNSLTHVTNTTVSGNTANSYGGGWSNFGASPIYFDENGDLYIDRSTISDNISYGTSAGFHLTSGGLNDGARPNNVVISNSTISGNNASANGGAFFIYDSNITIEQSTVSGNTSHSVGGGFYGQVACDLTAGDTVPCYVGESVEAVFIINQSTFANNYSGSGAGVQVADNTSITISNSLLSDNLTAGTAATSDFSGGGGVGNPDTGAMATVAIDYSWVAADTNGAAAAAAGAGNVIGTGLAGIGALANNGGPTETHALLTGSLAIDAADPTITGGTDQRGYGPRDAGGRADMGAYEFPFGDLPIGDFDSDGIADCDDINMLSQDVAAGLYTALFDLNGDTVVDSADIDEWLTLTGNTQGDANLDGSVGGGDFAIWSANKFTSNANWCDGDFDGDGSVGGQDFLLWNANKTVPPAPLAGPDAGGKLDAGQRNIRNAGTLKNGDGIHGESRADNMSQMRERGMQVQRIHVATSAVTPIAAPAAVSFSASDVVASEVKNSTAVAAGTDKLEATETVKAETARPALRIQAVNRFDSVANHDDAEEHAVDSPFASLGSEL